MREKKEPPNPLGKQFGVKGKTNNQGIHSIPCITHPLRFLTKSSNIIV